MDFLLVKIIVLLSVMGIVTYLMIKNEKDTIFDKRKEQISTRFRENIVKRKLETYLDQKVKRTKKEEIEHLGQQAGVPVTIGEYYILSMITATIGFVVGTVLFKNPILGVLLLFMGWVTPNQLLTFLKNKRFDKTEKQVGSFLQIVIKRYEITGSLKKAIQMSVPDFIGQEPFYTDLKKSVAEMEVGKSTEEALYDLAVRTGNRYLFRLHDYYKVTKNVGSVEIKNKLLNQAYVQYREAEQVKSTAKRELAGVKREAYIMLATIPLFAVYQAFVSEGYFTFMTETMLGKIGIVSIVFVFFMSLWFINKKIGAPLE